MYQYIGKQQDIKEGIVWKAKLTLCMMNYKKKQSELEKAKNNSLAELNQQKADGEVEYYNEKNKSSLANQKNTQAIRDYMARNNLLNSGENADAILRNRADYANDIG